MPRPFQETGAFEGVAIPELCRSGWAGHIYRRKRFLRFVLWRLGTSQTLLSHKTKQRGDVHGYVICSPHYTLLIIRPIGGVDVYIHTAWASALLLVLD